jgi:hypothetical protein
MRRNTFIFNLLLCAFLCAVSTDAQTLRSPNGSLVMDFSLTRTGEPTYRLSFKGKPVIKESKLGLVLKDAPALRAGFTKVTEGRQSRDETWEPVWGEVRVIRDRHNEMSLVLRQASTARFMIVRFRLFDDGLAFRYELPDQPGLQSFVLDDELTEFNLTADHRAFWMPGDYDTNEYSYNTTRLSGVVVGKARNNGEINFSRQFYENAVQTPLALKTDDGLYISIHEAALKDYPAYYLVVNRVTFRLTSHLARNSQGSAAFLNTPAQTPWRTFIVSDKAVDLVASKTILNLNEPHSLTDTAWIRPRKFVGVWWEMHVGRSSWEYGATANVKLGETDWSSLRPTLTHGANTENVKRYIDFAAKHGIEGVLVEGWNVGWEDWYGKWKENVFDFVTPYPDFDLEELKRHAAASGVKLIMHHETSASATNYERRLGEAFAFMKKHGYDTVKTGYVGRIIPRGETHDGQWMVNHYNWVAERAAESRIMLNVHEAVRPTGLHRTYPNWLSSESARGNEFNAWSVGNLPEHETILPFTRLMGGPMDYTPGIFQLDLGVYREGKKERVRTTLAKQLALFVTIYSPMQMAADLPENYERSLDAFQFIKDVPVDWDDTVVVNAEPGDFVTVARRAKGRDEWYLGSITDENGRQWNIPLTFLTPGREYIATVYRDADDAHWEKNPAKYVIERLTVNSSMSLPLALAPGGGAAVSFKLR